MSDHDVDPAVNRRTNEHHCFVCGERIHWVQAYFPDPPSHWEHGKPALSDYMPWRAT